MNLSRATKAILTVSLLGLLVLAPLHTALSGKLGFFETLEMLWISHLISKFGEGFTEAELARLNNAMPTIKEKNPKLYKDQRKTERILMLYMVLDQITQLQKEGKPLETLVGKSRGEVAREYVERVYFPYK